MRILMACILGIASSAAFAQTKPTSNGQGGKSPRLFRFEKKATVNFTEVQDNYAPSLLIREMPRQGSKKMVHYNYPERKSKPSHSSVILKAPVKGMSFQANNFSISTPNDNDFAMSDSIIVSVANTTIYMRNVKRNTNVPGKTLSGFTSPVNNFHEEFDPKVLYDPQSDRFILTCLVGSVDTTSKIIVGFSKTSNPAGAWNLYTLPGDALNNGLWSDYPMIAVSENELFLSVNLLYNDSSWQTGFVETVVWQIRKTNGYAGDSLTAALHSGVTYGGKAVRNLCPVKGGTGPYGRNMFFLSNRNLASQNDTVFLVSIGDTIGTAAATVSTKALVTSQPYFFPPDGRQPVPSQSLATNDCRNLGAFYENGTIQYVHNTKNPSNGRPTIYYGTISAAASPSPIANGYILENDSMDFAYPNLSYAGDTLTDNSAIISFNHSSDKVYPGCSAVQTDGAGNFSPVVRIQNGATYINLLTSNLERWGDYSGSQRHYGKKGEVWLSGYYGVGSGFQYPRAHASWVAQLITDTVFYLGLNVESEFPEPLVFPNPSSSRFNVQFTLNAPEFLTFSLCDATGRSVSILLRDLVRVKENTFSFSTTGLAPGAYLLDVSGSRGTHFTRKIIVN